MHRTNNQEILTVKIRSPEAATYRFELVGRDSTILDEGYDYDWIAIYRIVFRLVNVFVTVYPAQRVASVPLLLLNKPLCSPGLQNQNDKVDEKAMIRNLILAQTRTGKRTRTIKMA